MIGDRRSSHRHVTEPWSSARSTTTRKIPRSNPCGRGGEKDALYRWKSMGDSFLNAHGRTTN
eukprot:1141847-Pelagomonas_calceolata.AAC.3